MELELDTNEVAETVNGMRYDTFLADSDTLSSEEFLQPHRTAEEEEEIRKGIISVLYQKNRLPD